jgi:nucleotide-binding universal stress UspA family protein
MNTIPSTRCGVFDRVVCAFDGSQRSVEAIRQARILRSDHGELEIDSVFELQAVVYSPYGGPLMVSEDEENVAAEQLAQAQSLCPDAATHLFHGSTVGRLLERLSEWNATLVAVGATNRNRGLGVVRGSVMTRMLHRAPSSVLVARTPAGGFPRAVVVGYDGSPAADRALAAGLNVADRYDARLRVVVAGTDLSNDFDRLAGLDVERDERGPVEALCAASHDSDLLIVGSRGLHGVHALGSVSERVGHQAACSVLVVR